MRRLGYEVDEMSARKAMYSWKTGLFTRKQIHTIVFRKAEPSSRPTAVAGNMTELSTGVPPETQVKKTPSELFEDVVAFVRRLARATKYLIGKTPELGEPVEDAEGSTSTTADAEPTPFAKRLMPVMKYLATPEPRESGEGTKSSASTPRESERTQLVGSVAGELTDAAPSEPTEPVSSTADELAKLAVLRDSGVLTGEEFDAQKAKLLAR